MAGCMTSRPRPTNRWRSSLLGSTSASRSSEAAIVEGSRCRAIDKMGAPHNKGMKQTKPGKLRSFAAYPCVRQTPRGATNDADYGADDGIAGPCYAYRSPWLCVAHVGWAAPGRAELLTGAPSSRAPPSGTAPARTRSSKGRRRAARRSLGITLGAKAPLEGQDDGASVDRACRLLLALAHEIYSVVRSIVLPGDAALMHTPTKGYDLGVASKTRSRSTLSNKGMKQTSVEHIGRSQLIPGVGQTWSR